MGMSLLSMGIGSGFMLHDLGRLAMRLGKKLSEILVGLMF